VVRGFLVARLPTGDFPEGEVEKLGATSGRTGRDDGGSWSKRGVVALFTLQMML
jgi:hypothetical protein